MTCSTVLDTIKRFLQFSHTSRPIKVLQQHASRVRIARWNRLEMFESRRRNFLNRCVVCPAEVDLDQEKTLMRMKTEQDYILYCDIVKQGIKIIHRQLILWFGLTVRVSLSILKSNLWSQRMYVSERPGRCQTVSRAFNRGFEKFKNALIIWVRKSWPSNCPSINVAVFLFNSLANCGACEPETDSGWVGGGGGGQRKDPLFGRLNTHSSSGQQESCFDG